MTEAEWDSCTDPDAMLKFLLGRASARKLRLFACACCRRVWDLLPDRRTRDVVEMSERYADRLVRRKELTESRERALLVAEIRSDTAPAESAATAVARPQLAPAWVAILTRDAARAARPQEAECAAQARLLHEVFGNHLRPVALDDAWLACNGSAVVKLARVIYEERSLPSGHLDASRLAVLADMLEEAGATDAHLLGHLRSEGPHVRGCVAVDTLLGKC
jgi:hypothetical protein